MSKNDFTTAEFESRRAAAREALVAAGLDWMILFHPVSIRWLTGSDAKSYQEFQCLFLSAKPGPICVLARSGEEAEFRTDAWVDVVFPYGGGEPDDPLAFFERAARSLGVPGTKVGIEVPSFYLHPHHYVQLKKLLGDSCLEATNLILDLTLVKSETELRYIREAARIGDLAMARFAGALAVGKNELELAGEVYHELLTSGSGLAASPINLVSGERSCYSHGAPTHRKLVASDYGNIEYGSTYKRYTSTIGRQFCMGRPTARIREIFDVVCRASDAMVKEIRDGVPAVVPHEVAKRVIVEAGFERGRVHLSGYGLSPGSPPSWAEPIHLFGGNKHVLKEGMVVTIEPPIFLGEEKIGARVIDNVLVTKEGCEILSRFPRDIIVA